MLPAVVPRTRSMTGKCSLLRQKRRRLHEKRGERGQTDVGHSIRRVVARPPIRKGRAQSLEARHERFEHHAALESKRPRPVDESPRRTADDYRSVIMRIAGRTVETLTALIGKLVTDFDPIECANYIREAGYGVKPK